jgi:hypothetical protein
LIAKIAVPPTWNGTIAGNLNSYNEDMDSLWNHPHVLLRNSWRGGRRCQARFVSASPTMSTLWSKRAWQISWSSFGSPACTGKPPQFQKPKRRHRNCGTFSSGCVDSLGPTTDRPETIVGGWSLQTLPRSRSSRVRCVREAANPRRWRECGTELCQEAKPGFQAY